MTKVVILLAGGFVCLLIAGYLMYLQLPRQNRVAAAWLNSESGSTAAALGSFILLVAGISLLIKAAG